MHFFLIIRKILNFAKFSKNTGIFKVLKHTEIITKNANVLQELVSYNMDITVLTETKRKGEWNDINGEYIYFYRGVNKHKRQRNNMQIRS